MPDECTTISRYFVPLVRAVPEALGLADDAAVCPLPDGVDTCLVATSDAIVANVHYLPDDPPESIAAKLLRVNLSDLAAMGATPYGVLLVCGYPQGCPEDWIARFAEGLHQDLMRYRVVLLGGDTVTSAHPHPHGWYAVTALGFVPKGQALCRHGAHVGDDLYVTGTIGDAVLGLRVAQQEAPSYIPADGCDFLRQRYRYPEPRLTVGTALRGIATATMDCSDGLLASVRTLALQAGVHIVLDIAQVPCSPPAALWRDHDRAIHCQMLTGGDDYELVFTAPPIHAEALAALTARTGVPITKLGACTPPIATAMPVTCRIPDAWDGLHGLLATTAWGYTHR
jgi:thiamine-monophosphate kinase